MGQEIQNQCYPVMFVLLLVLINDFCPSVPMRVLVSDSGWSPKSPSKTHYRRRGGEEFLCPLWRAPIYLVLVVVACLVQLFQNSNLSKFGVHIHTFVTLLSMVCLLLQDQYRMRIWTICFHAIDLHR